MTGADPGLVLDMDALTQEQRDVLGAIACNQDLGHPPRILAALLDKGLISHHTEAIEEFSLSVRGPILSLLRDRWEVPLPVHIQWAKWCADQTDTESDER